MGLWNSGSILRAWMGCEPLFPLTIAAGTPTAKQLQNDIGAVEAWRKSIEEHCQCHLGHGYRIEYAEVSNRQLGPQRLPANLIFDQVHDLVAFIDKGRDVSRFARLLAQIRKSDIRLMPWCERSPMKVLDYEKDWNGLLAAVEYIKKNPAPHRPPGELDIPLVDDKFIEQRKLVICQLLDLVLPGEYCQAGV